MKNPGASIRPNGKEVRNPAARTLIGTILAGGFTVLFICGIVLLVLVPYIILIVFGVVAGIALTVGVISYPFDWVLKRLGRAGTIHANGRGGYTFIFDRRIFRRASPKAPKE